SRGLGNAASRALLKKGARVYGISRSEPDLQALAKEWGDGFIPVVLDLSLEEKVNSWVAETFSEAMAPDILINNAGAGYFGEIDSLGSERLHQMIDTNLNAVFYLTAAVVPYMK